MGSKVLQCHSTGERIHTRVFRKRMARGRVRGGQADGCDTAEDRGGLQRSNKVGRDVPPAHSGFNDELGYPADAS
jgi:hypothetical protein